MRFSQMYIFGAPIESEGPGIWYLLNSRGLDKQTNNMNMLPTVNTFQGNALNGVITKIGGFPDIKGVRDAILDDWTIQRPPYDRMDDCCLTLAQSFESLVLRVSIQDKTYTNPAAMIEWYDEGNSSLALEYEGASTTCLRIAPNPRHFPIRSGVGNGVSMLLDLETFDNADLGMAEDGLSMLVTDRNDYSLLDLNGFAVKPGVAKNVKIHPVLFEASSAALDNFNDNDRRCVNAENPTVSDQMSEAEMPYSLSNCLLTATVEQIYANCSGILDFDRKRDGMMNATGPALGCINSFISQMGTWRTLRSGFTCLDSCKRQENRLAISDSKFPNKMFVHSEDFFLVIRKLWWTCTNTTNKFGPKRKMLEVEYPDLCLFYDDYIYPDQSLNNLLKDSSSTVDVPVQDFLVRINMTEVEMDRFKNVLLEYCRNNLVKVVTYIEKVYAEKYKTDEVRNTPSLTLYLQVMSVNTLIANLGGMMGLCMGMSLVSAIEIGYFIVKCIFSGIKTNLK